MNNLNNMKEELNNDKQVLKNKQIQYEENQKKLEEVNSKNVSMKKELENYHSLKMEYLTI